MTTEIADLIFDNNSTLFEVLDNLSVPSLSEQVVSLNTRVLDVSDQLRQLGLLVDSNQVSNNTSFVSVNTKIDLLNSSVSSLLSTVETLLTDFDIVQQQSNEAISRLIEVEADVNTLTTKTNDTSSRLVLLNSIVSTEQTKTSVLRTDVDRHTTQLTGLTSRVTALETQLPSITSRLTALEAQTGQISSITSRITSIESKFNSIPLSLQELYYSSAYVVSGVIYVAVNQASTNYYQRQLRIDGVAGVSLRMGQPLKGLFNGANYAYMLFTDDVTGVNGDSFQTQNGMIPVGGPIGFRYGSSSSSYTFANIRITKQYLRT